jgi:uncharacterized protein (TIGR03067 family)
MSELSRLEGIWTGRFIRNDNEGKSQDDASKLRVVIRHRRLSVGRGEPYRISLSPTAKPKTMDLVHSDDSARPLLAIYELHGDNLTICTRSPGDTRPHAFGEKKPDIVFFILKRAKAE